LRCTAASLHPLSVPSCHRGSALLAKILDFAPHYRPEVDTPLINALVICLMIGGMVYYWPSLPRCSVLLPNSTSQDSPLPESSSAAGRVLNAYLWGVT